MVFDPHRAGHELLYYPGETNLLMADVAIINKVDTASAGDIETVRSNIERYAPNAEIVLARSPVIVNCPEDIASQRVLVVEDGPTLTHGGMPFGAGTIAARTCGASQIVDVRPYAVGSIRETYSRYPHIGPQLPAMGYGEEQIQDLEETINRTPCDLVFSATPIDIASVVSVNKPVIRVRYEYEDYGPPLLEEVLLRRFSRLNEALKQQVP